jgi:hypothetical protein
MAASRRILYTLRGESGNDISGAGNDSFSGPVFGFPWIPDSIQGVANYCMFESGITADLSLGLLRDGTANVGNDTAFDAILTGTGSIDTLLNIVVKVNKSLNASAIVPCCVAEVPRYALIP